MTYNPGTDEGRVRLLINDVDASSDGVNHIFTDVEIETFLALEGGSIKLAAAQALDTIADNEALTSKVIRTQDVSTDGAKVADSLRKRADALRKQAAAAGDGDDEGGFAFEVAAFSPYGPGGIELAEHEYYTLLP